VVTFDELDENANREGKRKGVRGALASWWEREPLFDPLNPGRKTRQ